MILKLSLRFKISFQRTTIGFSGGLFCFKLVAVGLFVSWPRTLASRAILFVCTCIFSPSPNSTTTAVLSLKSPNLISTEASQIVFIWSCKSALGSNTGFKIPSKPNSQKITMFETHEQWNNMFTLMINVSIKKIGGSGGSFFPPIS